MTVSDVYYLTTSFQPRKVHAIIRHQAKVDKCIACTQYPVVLASTINVLYKTAKKYNKVLKPRFQQAFQNYLKYLKLLKYLFQMWLLHHLPALHPRHDLHTPLGTYLCVQLLKWQLNVQIPIFISIDIIFVEKPNFFLFEVFFFQWLEIRPQMYLRTLVLVSNNSFYHFICRHSPSSGLARQVLDFCIEFIGLKI